MKIIKIVVARQDKSGQTYTSQYSGKEQARVALQVDSPMYQGKWVSNFVDLGDPSEQWKEGQDVDIEIIPKGQYLNWKLRKVGQAQTQGGYAQLFEKLFMTLNRIEGKVDTIAGNFGLSERPKQGAIKTENDDLIPF